MTKIFNLFSRVGVRLINHRTGTEVITTGNHGDKTKGYKFEAYRVLENGISEEPEWFYKVSFDEK